MITIQISIGEAIDKLSILMIKQKFITDQTKLEYINVEISQLVKSLDEIGDYSHFLNDLLDINELMWSCNETRKKKINDKEFDQQYIQLTITESNVNDQRFVIKDNINKTFNSALREQKSYSWVT